jgi:hypothetical protein
MKIKEINNRVLCPLAMKVATMCCIDDPEDELNEVYMAK